MGKGEEATANLPVTRIFVGGLSMSVTAADLEKIFCSLGKIRSTEFVRSDGRSFAFMDFEPNSDKTLAKLFATYNGCTWKGAKLRLEKAKEHYLTRLNREWDEDARITTSVSLDLEKSPNHSRNSECSNQENAHLRIFFPKLKKVKALPFKGTGKHKYSFQRIEVPTLPIHFCDCEEHCEPLERANERYLSALHSAESEKERAILNNVLSKLLEKEGEEAKVKEVPASGTINLNDSEVVDSSDKDIQVKQSEEKQSEEKQSEEMSEADNLVTNIGSMQSDEIMIQQLIGKEMNSVDQESRISRPKHLEHELPQSKAYSKKMHKTALCLTPDASLLKAASPTSEVSTSEDESVPISMGKVSSSNIEERENFAGGSNDKSQTECTTDAAKPATANTWMQKFSWRELVGEPGLSSFSISNIVAGTNLEPTRQPNAKDSNTMSSAAQRCSSKDSILMLSSTQKKRKSRFDGQGSKPLQLEQNIQLQNLASGAVETPHKGEPCTENGDQDNMNNRCQDQRRAVSKIEIGQFCTFMRDAESEKQWLKLKNALVKKKKKGINESKESEGKRSRR